MQNELSGPWQPPSLASSPEVLLGERASYCTFFFAFFLSSLADGLVVWEWGEIRSEVRAARYRATAFARRLGVFAALSDFLLLEVCCWLRRKSKRTLVPGLAGGRRGPYQLLLRSQGPRGPIAIACPVTTPNQSLRADACNIFLSAPVYGLLLVGVASRPLGGGNDDVSRDNGTEAARLLSN